MMRRHRARGWRAATVVGALGLALAGCGVFDDGQPDDGQGGGTAEETDDGQDSAAAAADGEPIERHEETAEAGWDDVEAALQAPRATARVFSTTPGGGEHELFVIADGDGVWALTGLADGGLRAARVSRERLASVLLTLLGAEEGQ